MSLNETIQNSKTGTRIQEDKEVKAAAAKAIVKVVKGIKTVATNNETIIKEATKAKIVPLTKAKAIAKAAKTGEHKETKATAINKVAKATKTVIHGNGTTAGINKAGRKPHNKLNGHKVQA